MVIGAFLNHGPQRRHGQCPRDAEEVAGHVATGAGLDTLLGVGGHPLTDAQAQQLALARLLLADADLVILDEATAEAGSAYAGQLDRAADAVLAGRTAVVVAHRLSQAATCDRIMVMERGRIIETGTHGELVDAGGVYAGLWTAWEAAPWEAAQ